MVQANRAFDTTLNTEQTNWLSFGSIAYNLVKNLVVSINNMHIRYEDDEQHFAFGIHLEKMQIPNNDSRGNTEEHLSVKIYEINNIDLYSDSAILYQNYEDAAIIKEMSPNGVSQPSEFIIEPT